MTLDSLRNARRVIGLKQVSKAVSKEQVVCVFIASDADLRLVRSLKALCEEKAVAVVDTATMMELGHVCSIEVGAAAAAILK